MQQGRIYRKGRAWILDYAVKELRDGVPRWAKRSKKLAPVCEAFRTEASVRHLAAEHLAPYNARQARPESTDTVAFFIENIYLPHCKANLRPSTYNGYKFLFKWLQPHIGDQRLRDFGPVEAERVLNDFAEEKPRANNLMRHVKGFLSGAFRYAVRMGTIRFNPMRETKLPKNVKAAEETHAYTLAEINAMLKVLQEPARTVVLVAAFTGLRLSEVRGLRWTDIEGDLLHVQRSVWRKHVSDTKTVASAGDVPLLPVVTEALEEHREGSTSEYIFAGGTGQPLVIANMTRRDIVPVLDTNRIAWHGWHGFRRGLSTNLYELGVQDKVIQAILRHADVAVTRKHYIKTRTEQSEAAMKELAKAWKRVRKTVRKS
jgi:integrase